MYKFFKRFFDLLFAIILSLLLLPLTLTVAVILACKRDGGIFFRQKRPGKNGKIISVLKFRTMRIQTFENGKELSDFERIFPFGNFLRKTSLDELPQFFNIIKGDLSFIGPRPLLCEYLPLYSTAQARRHDVRPGITGLAQVNGRNALTWEKKFELDVFYVDNTSFSLDVKIFLKTLCSVFKGTGINAGEQVTMEKFRGSDKTVFENQHCIK